MSIKKKNIAIIPARGGSKRIPRKNIKLFAGKPVIAYSIEAALESGLFNTVMVSTDDEEIAAVAKQYGAAVPFFRSRENANDFATTPDVLLEVFNTYSMQNEHFADACCIYPCAPFITGRILVEAYNKLKADNSDSVFPIIKFHAPIQRALKVDSGLVRMFQPEHIKTRSQDLEPAYYDAGQFYWFNVERFLGKKVIWTDNTTGIILSELKGHDIDNLEDWKIAEIKYQILQQQNVSS